MRFFRFFLMGVSIGVADLIPGVSGGTLAFTFGVWERVITSIANVAKVIRLVFQLQFAASWSVLGEIDWRLLVPLGCGVLTAVVGGASLIGYFIENHPVYLRALFLGVLIGVISLPFQSIARWTPFLGVLFLVGAVISFYASGIPQQSVEQPPLLIIVLIGAITICATILPGLSGSFLLMIFGVYEIFINSVRDRDIAIWASFALGALLGTLLFSSLLKWVLSRYREIVMAILLGLTAGATRILWPWLGADRELLFPDDLFRTGCWLIAGIGIALSMRLFIGTYDPNLPDQKTT
jgi:putative membrane protein